MENKIHISALDSTVYLLLFNLKEDRAKEDKQEKVQSVLFVSAAAVFIVAFVAIIYS